MYFIGLFIKIPLLFYKVTSISHHFGHFLPLNYTQHCRLTQALMPLNVVNKFLQDPPFLMLITENKILKRGEEKNSNVFLKHKGTKEPRELDLRGRRKW